MVNPTAAADAGINQLVRIRGQQLSPQTRPFHNVDKRIEYRVGVESLSANFESNAQEIENSLVGRHPVYACGFVE